MHQEDSWYMLTPGIVNQDRPAAFGPKDVSPVAVHFLLDFKMLESTLEVNSLVCGTVP